MNQTFRDWQNIVYLVEHVAELLESGDSTGCDRLIVVEIDKYHLVRRSMNTVTGIWYGESEPNE